MYLAGAPFFATVFLLAAAGILASFATKARA